MDATELHRKLIEWLDEYAAERGHPPDTFVPGVGGALRAAVELHAPHRDRDYPESTPTCTADVEYYPCETITAVAGALGVEIADA